MLLIFALFVVSASANAVFEPCPPGKIVKCFADPCRVSKGCPAYPDAVCHSNYCGGCRAYYYQNGVKVDCNKPALATREEPCEGTIVNCLIDPCMTAKCAAHPDADCHSNYCNGCNAHFYLHGERVNCASESQPMVSGICPKPNGFGVCAELCDNCEAKDQLCCSNGCGHQCVDPVNEPEMERLRPAIKGYCPSTAGLFGVCAELCDNCEAKGQLCCSNGCGHQCMDPVLPAIEPKPPVLGVCPKPKGPGPCIHFCNNCEAKGKLCCSNGCGAQCMDPVPREEDEEVVAAVRAVTKGCPKPKGFGLCAEMCNNCGAQGKICCSNGCGHQCMTPVSKREEEAEKRDFPTRYECPKLEPETIGICMDDCRKDEDCNGGALFGEKKCCSNGCGKTCKAGVLPKKTGHCPKSPSFGPCVITCSSHQHCEGDTLCCPNGCGQLCKKPVFD